MYRRPLAFYELYYLVNIFSLFYEISRHHGRCSSMAILAMDVDLFTHRDQFFQH